MGQDYYRFNPDLRQLVGEHSGKIYKTGDKIEIKVARVDMDQGRIDFALSEMPDDKNVKPRNYKSKKTRSKKSKSKLSKVERSKEKSVKSKHRKKKHI